MTKDNKIKLRKSLQVVGVCVVLLGGYRLVKDFSLFIKIFSDGFRYILNNGFNLEALFLLFDPVFVILFEVFFVYAGINSFKACLPKSVKCLCYAFIVVIAERLSNLIYWITEMADSEAIRLIYLIIVSFSFFLYRVIAKLLVERFFPAEKFPIFHEGKIAFMLMYLYFLLSGEVRNFVPTKEGYDHVPQEPWGMISFVGCLILFIILYKIIGMVLMAKDAKR